MTMLVDAEAHTDAFRAAVPETAACPEPLRRPRRRLLATWTPSAPLCASCADPTHRGTLGTEAQWVWH